MKLDRNYWEAQYLIKQTGWDLGYPSPPLVEYIDQLTHKDIRILVPGAGNAWEVEYLWKMGFWNTYLLDFSSTAIERFKKRVPEFPADHIFEEDFFKHQKTYDLVLEQTFFSSLLPEQREKYVCKMHEILSGGGKLVGVVFNHEFSFEGPPFGATPESYISLINPYFGIEVFEEAFNSIKPRKGREHFLIARR